MDIASSPPAVLIRQPPVLMKIWSLVTSCSSTPACRESEWRCLVDKSTRAAASGCCSAARYADCRLQGVSHADSWALQWGQHTRVQIYKLGMYLQCIYSVCLMSTDFLHISICNTSSFIIYDFDEFFTKSPLK